MKKVIRQYSAKALKNLQALDKQTANRIVTKIKTYSENSNPLEKAKRLSGILSGLYRYRVGDYRVIFEVNSEGVVIILTILNIKHRKDIYK